MILRQNHRGNRQNGIQHTKQNQNTCGRPGPSLVSYVGNIFLLGLATLTSELVDLRAGTALEYLLAPFSGESGADLEQDILGAEVGGAVEQDELLDVAEEDGAVPL